MKDFMGLNDAYYGGNNHYEHLGSNFQTQIAKKLRTIEGNILCIKCSILYELSVNTTLVPY
jgi:hypothetical protein